MAQLYTYEAVNNLIDRYYQKDAVNTCVYTLTGCLVDNHIIVAPNCKAAVIKEVYLNEWSSANSITMYNKLPKKYERVIELLENDEEDKALKLFFK